MIKTWEHKSLQQSLVQFCLLACLFVSLFKDWSKQMPLSPREFSYFLRLRKFDRACSFAWLAAMRIYWNKNSVCIRNEFNSRRAGLGHQHGCRFNALKYQYVCRDVMWKHSILITYPYRDPCSELGYSAGLFYFVELPLNEVWERNCNKHVYSCK